MLTGCRPVYYGAISVAEFEDGGKHALLGKDFRRIIAQLGEPTDIIFDKPEAMVWIYEVDETSSNVLQILSILTTGLLGKRKILIIEFDPNGHVAGSDIKRSKTHLVGMIGRVNHLTREIQAKKRVRSALDQLKSINSGTR